MRYIADLHIHSKYSRATAKNLDLEHLYISARLKGIDLVATGDFTHPAWFAELQEKLVPAETGFFRLRDDIRRASDQEIPRSCRGDVRFILESEISNIYKKDGKTRKNHNLIFAPDFESAGRFIEKLDAVGNLKSDGRPILGLDARNLLEIMLECSDDAFLIPAHIWTPWFSMFGSKSGFDSVTACFGDLADEIFAVETGLSSDAPMNWRVSELDSRTLVSNSDAHSPANLGRNANIFDTEYSFTGLRNALKSKDPAQCLGTLDMYPEEGKYHMDGHRKCGVWLKPEQSIAKDNLCPVCGNGLTLGVLHRVAALADRPEGQKPEGAISCKYIIPLPEILSELLSVGPKSKKVAGCFMSALEKLGPELEILTRMPEKEIEKTNIPLLAEAVSRMHDGRIHIAPGFDGEYGRITVFAPGEKEDLMGQQTLFSLPKKSSGKKSAGYKKSVPDKQAKSSSPEIKTMEPPAGKGLNEEQQAAVDHEGGPLIIIAGPGTGKTRTLTERIAALIRERNVSSESILAVTFTNKAAQEMRERISALLNSPASENLPLIGTFHAVCLKILRGELGFDGMIIDEESKLGLLEEAIRQTPDLQKKKKVKPNKLEAAVSRAKQSGLGPADDLASFSEEIPRFVELYDRYQRLLALENLVDFDDLLCRTVKEMETSETLQKKYQQKWPYILIDEYQDINEIQHRFIRLIVSEETSLFAIGDPDQSIYGFRGSDVRFFTRFTEDFPGSRQIRFQRNYRSAETILESSHQLIRSQTLHPDGSRLRSYIDGPKKLHIFSVNSEKAEAAAVGKRIEDMIGGIGFHSIDFGKTGQTGKETDYSFSDFAVLYRRHDQADVFKDAFDKAGLPWQIASRRDQYTQPGISHLLSYLKLTEGCGMILDIENLICFEHPDTSARVISAVKEYAYARRISAETLLADPKKLPDSLTGSAGAIESIRFFAEKMNQWKKETDEKTVTEKLNYFLDADEKRLRSYIEEDLRKTKFLESLIEKSKRYNGETDAFIESLAFQNDPDVWEASSQKISFLTFHAAKGLEFPVVFIVGCEDGWVPLRFSDIDDAALQEERRLLYVAMTRAKEHLFFSHARKRILYGRVAERSVSPFLNDIEKRLMAEEIQQKSRRPKKKQVQMGLF